MNVDLAAERAASRERQRPSYEAARARVRELLAREEGSDLERQCKTCGVIFLQKRTRGRPAMYCKAHRPIPR